MPGSGFDEASVKPKRTPIVIQQKDAAQVDRLIFGNGSEINEFDKDSLMRQMSVSDE